MQHKQVSGYKFITRVAKGGAGTIWKAVSSDKKKAVAVKMLNPGLLRDSAAKSAFEKEYKLCKDFKHPSLLKYHEYDKFNNTPYIMMQYFPSVTLKAAIGGDTTCPIFTNALTIITGIAEGLKYIHDLGIVHRDIKPDNVLLNKNGKVKLIDFSLAIGGMSKWMPLMRKSAGTPSYMPPEQIKNDKITPSADIYALGATIFEMLSGRPPFIADNQDLLLRAHLERKPRHVSSYNRGVSMDMDKMIASMLEKDPALRPPNMNSILMRLKKIEVFHKDASREMPTAVQ